MCLAMIVMCTFLCFDIAKAVVSPTTPALQSSGLAGAWGLKAPSCATAGGEVAVVGERHLPDYDDVDLCHDNGTITATGESSRRASCLSRTASADCGRGNGT
jgi:hypothetical protein